MKQVVTATEMKNIEKNIIKNIGIPSLVLMERAALCVAEHIKQRFTGKDKICVVCGVGNNGADGVAVARLLSENGYKVDVAIIGKQEKFSDEMKTQLLIYENLGFGYFSEIQDEDYACFVDAIFGIGLTRDITEESILKAIDTINSSDAYIYSVDIPSGIHTDTGKIMGKAVKADETITFTCKKTGLLLSYGKEYAGKVFCQNIGINDSSCKIKDMSHYTLMEYEGAELLKREINGNKGTFGKVTIIAGNDEISGAAILCAEAAMKTGAGMVKVLSNEKTLDIIRKTLPEAMVVSLDNGEEVEDKIQAAIHWADCVVIGPGIGTDEESYRKLHCTIKGFPDDRKLVVDADGINLLAKHKELKKMTEGVNKIVFTPHMMELARLTDIPVSVLKENLDIVMENVVAEDNAVYVCKDSVTRVYKKGKAVFINQFGNSGMATAGSGDVLAGVIAGLIARNGADYYEGAVLGVNIHSQAGDIAAKECGENSLLASDIAKALPKVLKRMEDSFNV